MARCFPALSAILPELSLAARGYADSLGGRAPFTFPCFTLIAEYCRLTICCFVVVVVVVVVVDGIVVYEVRSVDCGYWRCLID